MTNKVIATWFHADSPEQKGEYFQVRGDSSSLVHYSIYIDCVLFFFACIHKMQRKEKRKLFLNSLAFNQIKQADLDLLKKWNVEIVILENQHSKMRNKKSNFWQNQFFILDIISYETQFDNEVHIFDSDILTISNKSIEWESSSDLKLIKISDNPLEEINGLEVRDLTQIWSFYSDERLENAIPYYGGEYIGIHPNSLRKFSNILESSYKKNESLADSEEKTVQEEAHLISSITPFFKIDTDSTTFIKRIWTQPWVKRDIPINYNELTFLHIPAEKKTSIQRLAKVIRNDKSWFWEESEKKWKTKILIETGISKFPIKKYVMDFYMLRNGLWRHVRSG